jgi:hypothetical protein
LTRIGARDGKKNPRGYPRGVWSNPGGALLSLELPADLVIDCTGRRSKLPSWLEASGRMRVPEENLRIDLHYTTFTGEPAGKSRPREALTACSVMRG